MNESEKSKALNDEYGNDAQAVQKSELLPIYDAMSFSGDIQPLDDISQPEEISAEFGIRKSENRGTDVKSSKKKKMIFAAADLRIKKLIACIVILLVAASGLTAAYFGVKRTDVNTSAVTAVYRTENKNAVIRLADGTDYDIGEAREVSVSTDGMYVWFTRNTSSTTGKYDLRMIEVESKKSLKKQGRFVEKGIDEGWKTTKDGRFACYGITKSEITSCCMYSAELQKAFTVAESVEEFFPPSVGNVVYFTRRNGTIYSLHRAQFDSDSENVASGIGHVKFVCDKEDYEVLYTKPTGKGTDVNVFSVKGKEAPVTVCSDVSEVYLNDYVYGGNLYYFTKNKSNVNWQDFISDTYYEKDAKIKRPVESDYMIEKGFIFKRQVLDTTKYNAAMNQYKMKTVRDEIREELDKINLGLAVKDEYSCFVYSGGASHRLASGVTLDNIVEFAESGDPRLIYRKSVIGVGMEITMDDLVEISQQSNVQKAMDYVRNSVQSSYNVSSNCFYSWFDGSNVFEYVIDESNLSETEFIFSSGKELYEICEGELYFSEADGSEMSRKKLIDSNVSGCTELSDAMYYEKTDSSGAKALYKFSANGGKTEICKNVYSYFAVNNSFIIVLTRQSNSEELVSVGIYDGKGYALIDSNLSLNNFVYSGNAFAYIKNYKSGNGEMYLFTSEKGAVKCGDEVTQIMYIR